MTSVALFLVGAFADGQFGPEWTRIAQCTTLDRSMPRLIDGGRDRIAAMAQSATKVRICDWNSTSDCVTSIPGSYPINNLRNNIFLLGHTDNGNTACDGPCVAAAWTGPMARLMNLRVNCGDRNHDAMQHPDGAWMYWACGNGGGIHFGLPGGPCGWTASVGGAIEVFINDGTAVPTASPTANPTTWFESPGHATNFSELQTVVSGNEAALRSAMAAIETGNTERSTMAQQILDLTVAVDTLTDTVRALVTNTSVTTTEVAAIKAALRLAAISDSTGPGAGSATPSVEAMGASLILKAGRQGLVSLASDDCQVPNLCSSSSFADRLQQALADLEA